MQDTTGQVSGPFCLTDDPVRFTREGILLVAPMNQPKMSARVPSFPTAMVPGTPNSLPVEVTLITQLGHGAGDELYAKTLKQQQHHAAFVDEMSEPSARLASTDFSKGEHSALFSFSVGPDGHPFHRHAGHRVFTAIVGSAGALLRFSTVSDEDLHTHPASFFSHLHQIEIPPDCLFTVRFGGGTWHQFSSPAPGSHPALFALSCHTNEAGGLAKGQILDTVLQGNATIAGLTELLPASVQALMGGALDTPRVRTCLSLESPPNSVQTRICSHARSRAGHWRGWAQRWGTQGGFVQRMEGPSPKAVGTSPHSLLNHALTNVRIHHQDMVELHTRAGLEGTAPEILERLLEAMVNHPPAGVTSLMRVRNVLVVPLGLRTADLGCPVSSLASPIGEERFRGRFPVWQQRISENLEEAEVVLGANDKHLLFRSCVGVRKDGTHWVFSLGTRVHCRNGFGRFYMATIDRVHRHYIGPALLKTAAEHVQGIQQPQQR